MAVVVGKAMFKLHRHRSDRHGEKVDFRFSNFQAIEVPRGWDRLIISLVSVETGKTITKSNKAVARSGNCQWSDSFKETIWIPQDDASREPEECLYKLVLSMGSARSSILGEAVLNLTEYRNAKDSDPILLPLKNCNYETILQLKVQCLSPKSKSRDERHLKEPRARYEDSLAKNDDIDNRSDESDNIFNRSVGSSSGNHLGAGSYPDEPGNRDTSFSASGSHRSSDSGESCMARTNISPKNSPNGGVYNPIGRQDSTSSQNSAGNSAGPGEEILRSNHSSFSSRASSFQWQEANGQSSNDHSFRHTDSSKEFLEAAQETIEELRGESRMWEKTARKFKSDLESLKKENSDQSKHLDDLEMKLSSVCSERDDLKQELQQFKLSLEESEAKLVSSDIFNFQNEDVTQKQKELADELKFEKESNATLAHQLKKTQEANFELVSILQELEETIEKQRLEIASFSLHNQEMEHQRGSCDDSMDSDNEEACHLIAKEEKTDTSPMKSSESASLTGGDIDLIKELEALKVKVAELERDCAELTEENLELIYKLKESTKDSKKVESSLGSHTNSFQYAMSHSNAEFLQEPDNKEILSEGIATEPLTIRFRDLEKKCTDLELELQFFKDKACDLGVKLQMSHLEVEEKKLELVDLQQKLRNYQGIDQESSDAVSMLNSEKVDDSLSYMDTSILLSEIYKEIKKSIAHVKIPWYENDACVVTESDTPVDMNSITLKEQAEDILQSVLELDKLLGEKIVDCKLVFSHKNSDASMSDEILIRTQKQSEYSTSADFASISKELGSSYKNITEESILSISEVGDFRHSLLLKEDEIAALRHSKRKLEDLISELKGEMAQLKENLDVALRESSIASKCLDDVQQELLLVTSSMDSKVSENKILERKLSEVESGKEELEFHLSELEQENVHFSERISGLEAQLRYLTDEKESNRLELENSRSLATNLKNEIGKLEAEIEIQKADLKQKLQETHKRSSEAQEESEYLKRSHSKLQATAESLIDECSSLQKLNGDLRRQKLELHDKCVLLEVELSKSQEKCSDFVNKIDVLESKYVSLQKDTALKEKTLISQLEAICQEHREHEEKLSKVQIMLNEMDGEKMDEVESLHREIAHLTAQISSTHDERERIGSNAVREASTLRADKIKLENNLQEILVKVKSYETDLDNIRNESENRLQGLIGLLNASKQSEEMLIADMEHVRKLLEELKSKEEKAKRTANELELKLKASEFEEEQLKEEIATIKVQLQKIPRLQDDVSALKSSLDEAKFEKDKLEASLQLLSGECEELKVEKKSYMEKISTMQKVLSDGENARLSKVALEEKLLRLECDLTARDALYVHDAELKNEVNRFKRTNSQYQRKIQCLEEEKDEVLRRVQDLEKEIKLRKEEKRLPCLDEMEMDHNEDDAKEHGISELHVLPDSSKSMKLKDEQDEIWNKSGVVTPHPLKKADLESKILKLEMELAEALQTNSMYQKQLENLQSARDASTNSQTKTGDDSRVSSMEAELKDMRERYSEMSLRYAEVEAEREELVMQLKSVKKEKRWFS